MPTQQGGEWETLVSSLSKVSVSALFRGSALAAASAFVLGSCSGPAADGSAASAKPAAEAVSAVSEPETAGSAKRLRLLTQDQYLNTLAYVFGPDVRPDAYFPPAQRTDGLLSL